MRARILSIGLMIGLGVAGCSEDENRTGVPTEIVLQRATAYRQACAARNLENTAAENLALLESTLGGDEGDPMAATRNAATGFARAYHRHAELRHTIYAMADSAVNHASASVDSLRYEERADAVVVRVPAAGTVEANVMEAYNRDFTRILADDDDPCNWNIPDMTRR